MKEFVEALVTVIGAFALIVILVLLGSFLDGWVLMLGIGVLHGSWWAMVPTMGYWPAVLVDLTLGTWIALQATYSRNKSKD